MGSGRNSPGRRVHRVIDDRRSTARFSRGFGLSPILVALHPIPPSFSPNAIGFLYNFVEGDAVEEASQHVAGRVGIEIACENGSSGAASTFVGWDRARREGEDNGHN